MQQLKKEARALKRKAMDEGDSLGSEDGQGKRRREDDQYGEPLSLDFEAGCVYGDFVAGEYV